MQQESAVRVIGRGVAWNTVGTVADKVLAFGNVFLILSHLSVYEYGLTELVMSVVSTFGLFLIPGLAAVVTADLGVERGRQEYGRMKALFSEFFTVNVALGILAFCVMFFGSTIVAQMSGNVLIDKFFKIIAFTFLIAPLRGATLMLATVTIRYADQNLFSIVEEVAKGIILLIVFYFLGMGAPGLLYAIVISTLIAVVIFIPRTFSAYGEFSHAAPVDQQPLWNILREHRKWGVASSYIGTLSQNVRLWMIKLLLGTEAVGLFAFAFGLLSHLAGLLPLGSVLVPLIPRYVDRTRDLMRMLYAAIKIQILTACVFIVASFIAYPIGIQLFFAHYWDALPVAWIMLLALIPQGLIGLFTPLFISFKEQQTMVFSTVLKTVVSVIILPPLVWVFGLKGVGVEIVITLFVTTVERSWRLTKFLPEFSFGWRELLTLSHEDRLIIDGLKKYLRMRS